MAALGRALALPEDDITRDASIQRFEFSMELAWKVSKRWLGTDTSAPKQVIREMGQAGLISDVVLWLEAIDQRNLSSHTYNEDLAREVYAFASGFLPELQSLLDRVQQP
ncbi:Nucleotidyltransferase [Pseudohaliea rubra DSM 19751]|uniref:Nucleotidyltransferase n=1 Tax=Pseudohaliea rubra DSM 19751 TaxID=1265313 RepID=A0A095XTQ9_9GAMM|nr:Nucleotidyltransferase [Pseudohaliea rubra DSM 19751]